MVLRGAHNSRGLPASLVLLLLWLSVAALTAFPGCAQDGSSGGSESGGAENAASSSASPAKSPDSPSDPVSTEAGAPTDSTAEKAKRPISVDVAPVIRGDLIQVVLAEGILRARKEAEIKTEVSGVLERVLIEEGAAVRAGHLLALVDQREYRAALEEARARHLRALSELAVNLELNQAGAVDEAALADYQAKIQALRAELDAGRVSADDFRTRSLDLELAALQTGAFRREVLEARTGFAEARAAEEQALLNLERTEIHAPFAGTVTALEPVAGERISAGTMLCRIVNTRDLEAEVHVLESDLGALAVGHPALLTIPAVEMTLPVRVGVVSPAVDTDSRTCRVLLRFDNDSPRIRPGMFVRAEIAATVLPDRLLVPKEAVLERERRPLVFRVSGEQAQWVYVETGERNDRYVEVTGVAPGATLSPDDQVVVSDHLTLAHEALIQVRRVVAPDDPWRIHFPARGERPQE